MPNEMEMQRLLEQRMADLLRFANYTRVAEALGVTRTTVHRWAHGKAVTPGALTRVQAIMRPGTTKDAPPAEASGALSSEEARGFYEGLRDEIRLNRAVIESAFAEVDPGLARRILDRLAALPSRLERDDDEAPAETGGAGVGQRREAEQPLAFLPP